MENFMLFVSEYEQSDELFFEHTAVLKYSVKYPQFSAMGVSHFVGKLNTYYRKKADAMVELCKTIYYEEAALSYQECQKTGVPFRENDVYVTYTITNNRDCVLSLYMNEGRYTGGANGSNKQVSDTWDLGGERYMTLAELFPGDLHYQDSIIHEVEQQIAWQINNENAEYFEDYTRGVTEFFNPYDFYITPYFLAIYYQEMTIAPHASGIVTFPIPFVSGPIYPRVCAGNTYYIKK